MRHPYSRPPRERLDPPDDIAANDPIAEFGSAITIVGILAFVTLLACALLRSFHGG